MKILVALVFMLIATAAQAWNTPAAVFTGSKYTAWTWTGASGDHNFNNAANWCGAYVNNACQGQSSAPTTSSNVVFGNACSGTNCNVTLTAAVSVNNWQTLANYTGTISQGSYSITIAQSYTQMAGTFTAGSGGITIANSSASVNYPFVLGGGTFTGGSGNLSIGSSNSSGWMNTVFSGGNFISPSGTLTIWSYIIDWTGLASFSANGGTVFMSPPNHSGATLSILFNASYVFHHLQFSSANTHVITINQDISCDGDLTVNGQVSGGYLYGTGSISVTAGNVYHTGQDVFGTVPIKLTGTGTQFIDNTGATSGYPNMPNIVVQQTSMSAIARFNGSVTLAGGFTALAAYNSGSIDLNGASISFGSSGSDIAKFTSDLVTFPALTLSGKGLYQSFGTINVAGQLSLTNNTSSYAVSSGNGGTIFVGGDINATAGSLGGVTQIIELNGSGTQTLDTGGSAYTTLPGIRFNKTAGSVVFKNSVNGSSKVTGDFLFLPTGMAISSLTMPTITDFYIGNYNRTIQSNGFQFPSTANVHFLSDSNGALIHFNDDMTILGNLVFDQNTNQEAALTGNSANLNINLAGNLTYSGGAQGYYSYLATNPMTLKLIGASQTIDSSANGLTPYLPVLNVAASGTTTINSGTRSLTTYGYRYTSGTVDATASTINFAGGNPFTIYPGTTQFGNVNLSMQASLTINSGETLIAKGNLSLAAVITTRTLTGNIDVYGNVSSSGAVFNGPATINMKGNNSTFTPLVSIPTGTITIAKNAGQSVTMGATKTLSGSQAVNITSGSLNLAGYNLTLVGSSGTLTLATGTSVTRGGGILTLNGTIPPDGAYSNGVINP